MTIFILLRADKKDKKDLFAIMAAPLHWLEVGFLPDARVMRVAYA